MTNQQELSPADKSLCVIELQNHEGRLFEVWRERSMAACLSDIERIQKLGQAHDLIAEIPAKEDDQFGLADMVRAYEAKGTQYYTLRRVEPEGELFGIAWAQPAQGKFEDLGVTPEPSHVMAIRILQPDQGSRLFQDFVRSVVDNQFEDSATSGLCLVVDAEDKETVQLYERLGFSSNATNPNAHEAIELEMWCINPNFSE